MSERCINNAPFFAFQKQQRTYGVKQGCCNNWNCPRCGKQRAKEEYGRIIEGCKKITENNSALYFITITCKGREISVKEAEENYSKWCNTLLTAWRVQAKRTHQTWTYVAVTERQNRGHPHSHILTTFAPTDVYYGTKDNWKTDNYGSRKLEKIPCFRSDYIGRSCVKVGLGNQYDLSMATTVAGVSRYVAKYMFKDNLLKQIWPSGWKRVRYSQSFPKLPDVKTDAMVLITAEDWRELAQKAAILSTEDEASFEESVYRIGRSDTMILKPKIVNLVDNIKQLDVC